MDDLVMNSSLDEADAEQAHVLARHLACAVESRKAVEPPSELQPGLTLEGAYAVQARNIQLAVSRGDRIVGRKIGLTSVAMQEQLGVSSPDYGALLASMRILDGGVCHVPLLQPRIEAEIAFQLREDVRGPGVTAQQVLAATGRTFLALEVIDSRIANWRISLVDTVADNASSGAFALGDALHDGADLREVAVSVMRNGERVAEGRGDAVLGDPAASVAWLANVLAEHGTALVAGDIVLSGALHASIPVAAGDEFLAVTVGAEGERRQVSVRFGPGG